MDMAIDTLTGTHPQTQAPAEAPADLRDACQQFEGLLVGMILKKSLATTFQDEEQASGTGMDSFRDFCVEQVSSTLAQNSSLGLADQLLEQVGGRVQTEAL